jgi:AAA+ ATPase superfamily predicted ATPase
MGLSLQKQLQEKKLSILVKWQIFMLSSQENRQLLNAKKNQGRFANPAAYVSEKNTGKILDWLIEADDKENLFPPLAEICRLRAVQDMKPSQALCFIPALKQIIREELGDEINRSQNAEELWRLDKRIDELSLLAFDNYCECRDRINEAKVREIKRLYGRDAG